MFFCGVPSSMNVNCLRCDMLYCKLKNLKYLSSETAEEQKWFLNCFPATFLNLQKPGQTEPQLPLEPKPEVWPTTPKTSPQPDRTATTLDSPVQRWDVVNQWFRYYFTLGFTLSTLAPMRSTLAPCMFAPWIAGTLFQIKKGFQNVGAVLMGKCK